MFCGTRNFVHVFSGAGTGTGAMLDSLTAGSNPAVD